jgi:O-antigen ligase
MSKKEEIFLACLAIGLASFLGVQDIYSNAAYLMPIALLYSVSFFSRPTVNNPQKAWLGAWLVFCLGSVLWAEWKSSALWFGLILGLVPLSLLFFVPFLANPKIWFRIRAVLLAIFLLLSLWMVLELFATGGRASGPMIDANVAGALMAAAAIAIGFTIIFADLRTGLRRSLFGMYALFVLALFASGSRGALISFFCVSVFGFTLLASVKAQIFVGRLVVVGVLLVSAFMVVESAPGGAELYERETEGSEVFDSSLNARILLMKSSFEIVKSSPFLGVGLGNFKIYYPEVRSSMETESTGDFVHNDYLQLLVEGGPFLFFMPIVLGLMVLGVFLRWRSSRKELGFNLNFDAVSFEWVAISLAAGVILVQSLANFLLYVPFVSLVLAIILGRLWALQYGKAKTKSELVSRASPNVRNFLVALFVIFMSVLSITQLYSYNIYLQVSRGKSMPVFGSQLHNNLLLASYLNPIDHFSRFVLMQVSYNEAMRMQNDSFGIGFSELAWVDSEEFLRVMGRNCQANIIRARLINFFDIEASEKAFSALDPENLLDRTIQMFPSCAKAYLALSEIYESQGDLSGAASVLEYYVKYANFSRRNISPATSVMAELSRLYFEMEYFANARKLAVRVLELESENLVAKYVIEKLKIRLIGQD